jgi:hypothetical protein
VLQAIAHSRRRKKYEAAKEKISESGQATVREEPVLPLTAERIAPARETAGDRDAIVFVGGRVR